MTQPSAPDVLCIGETMALVTPTDGRGLATTRAVELTQAGAESNVARHLADHGVHVAWLSALGQDPLGERILAELRMQGVDVGWVDRVAEGPTGVFFKDPAPDGTRVHYYREGSAASRMTAQTADRWPLATARLVHLSGITPALSPGCSALSDAVMDRCRELGVTTSFDVNHRAGLWPSATAAPRLLELARRATLVFVGLDEAQALWDVRTAEDVAELVDGPRVVIVKDSDREAVELERGDGTTRTTRVPARRTTVVEPVGAGDAFAAGYLSAWLRGDDAVGRLELGHSLAAWTLGTSGDYRPGHGPDARPRTDGDGGS